MYIIPVGLIAQILRKWGEWVCIILGILAILGGGGAGGVVLLAIGIVWLIIRQSMKQKNDPGQTLQSQQAESAVHMKNTSSLQGTAVCSNCGAKLEISIDNMSAPREIFCSNCGAKFEIRPNNGTRQPQTVTNINNAPPQRAAFCPTCGTKAENGALFCRSCGTKLG